MKGHLLFLLSCISSTIVASSVVENATYDDLSANLLSTPLGTYKGLVYNSINLNGNTGTTITRVGGLASVSLPRRVLTTSVQTSVNGTASVTVAPPYKSLALLDFFFGCAINTEEGLATLAVQCTITVAGFLRNNNKEVALASYTFTPPPSPVTPVPMIHAVLPASFQKSLFNITFVQTGVDVGLAIDNLHYSLSK